MKRENNIFPLQTDAGKAGNDELIKMLEDKIQWYMLEASEEEFDTDELDAMVTLLAKLQQTPEPTEEETAEAWKKFQAYYDTRMEEERALEAAVNAEAKENESAESKEPIVVPAARKKNTLRNLWVAVGAAACLVIAVLISSGLGEVNANRGNGFFNWLKRDGEGTTLITSPENREDEKIKRYYDVQDVPDEFQIYVQQMETIPCLQEYDLEEIEIYGDIIERTIKGTYTQNEKVIIICVRLYSEKIMLIWNEFGEYKQYGSEMNGEILVNTFLKNNENKEKEYAIVFDEKNVRYEITGVEDINFLTQIASEYIETIVGE